MSLDNKGTVASVISSGGIGGAETFLYNFLTNFSNPTYRTVVIFLFQGGEIANKLKDSGIETYLLDIKNGFDFIGFLRFYKIIKKLSPRIIHFHDPCVTARFVSIVFPSVVKVVTDHGPTYHSFSSRKKRQVVAGRCLSKFTNCYIAVSNVMVKTLIECSGIHPSKIVKIYNGIPVTDFTNISEEQTFNIKKQYKLHHDTKVVMTICRLVKQKRIDLLLSAFEKTLEIYPECCLFIVGDGPLRSYLEEQARALSVLDKVRFLGFRKDTSTLLKMADIYACTSEWEAFSIVILEVMASGVPIVAFDVEGVNEAVIHNKTGFLARFNDIDTISNLMVNLLQDTKKACIFGKAGMRRIINEFTIDRNINSTTKVYDKCLMKNRCLREY